MANGHSSVVKEVPDAVGLRKGRVGGESRRADGEEGGSFPLQLIEKC